MFAGVLLLLIVLIYRVALSFVPGVTVAGLHNFSPVGALVLCGAVFFPRRWAVALPMGALFVSDLILNAHYGVSLLDWESLPQLIAFAIIAAIGWSLRGKAPGWRLFAASLAGSVIFFVVTNTASWAFKPQYAGGLSGWWQALTMGLPGYAPTWTFFRNTVVSDLVFTGLFVLCMGYRPAAAVPARLPVLTQPLA